MTFCDYCVKETEHTTGTCPKLVWKEHSSRFCNECCSEPKFIKVEERKEYHACRCGMSNFERDEIL